MVNLKKDGVMKLLRTTLIIVDKLWQILKVLHNEIHARHTRAYSANTRVSFFKNKGVESRWLSVELREKRPTKSDFT